MNGGVFFKLMHAEGNMLQDDAVKKLIATFMGESMATIKDVARLANSSITTVSRVLNQTGYVKQETRDKILEAIRMLHYQPLERSEGLTRTVGLIVPNIENPFFGKMANYLSAAANGSNYNILLFNINGSNPLTEEALFDLITRRVDGLIYASSHRSMQVIQAAQSKKIPIVVLDREIKNIQINSVTINNNYGAYLATTHLIALGHRQIAYLGGVAGMEISQRRKEGYLRALQENGIALDETYIGYGDYTLSSGVVCMDKLIAVHPEITGVVAATDLMAIGAINCLNKRGLRVPDDISIIGFDNIELAATMTPALTTVEYPMERMSEIVIDLILRQLKDEAPQSEAVMLFPKLIVRQSCRPVSGQDVEERD